MNLDNMIDVTGCDLIALVKKAYALSSPRGMGFLHARPGDLSDKDAKQIVEARHGIYMDYVHGRAVKFGVDKHEGRLYVRNTWFDHSQHDLRELLASIGKELPVTA